MEASVSTVENTRGVATPSGVPAEGDKVSVVEKGDRYVVYQINGREVTKEEWTQFHKKQEDQKKQRLER